MSIFPHEIGWRLLRKTQLGELLPDGIKIDFDRFHTSHNWVFRQGCSGPFGEDTFGDWLTADRARQLYQRVRGVFVRAGRPLAHCWYDVHATLSDSITIAGLVGQRRALRRRLTPPGQGRTGGPPQRMALPHF